ncbi:MAG: hypothetical protein WCY12_00215 [Candidatus Omnitrophota bacterium]
MNMKGNLTPEEKLLRLIRGKGKPEAKPAISGQDQPGPAAADAGPDKKIYSGARKFIALMNIEKILLVVFVLASLYAVSSFLYPFVGLRKITLPAAQPQKRDSVKENLKQVIEPFDYYEQSISGRQIFGQASSEGIAAAAINSNLIKDMNLVGILAGENPQAIIEDKKTLKTSYVVKGQFIGEFQVEDIQEGKIILNYRGQRYELYL